MATYIDFNATTPVDPHVFEAMAPFFRQSFGNASSGHTPGSLARAAVEGARAQVAELVGTSPSCVTFASSATEAINTAVWSMAVHGGGSRRRIVATAVEHSAVIESCRAVGRLGIDLTLSPVGESGQL